MEQTLAVKPVRRGGAAGTSLKAALEPGTAWSAVLDGVGLGVALLSRRGDYLRVNSVFAAFEGRNPDDFLGRNYLEQHRADESLQRNFARVLASGRGLSVRARLDSGQCAPPPGLGRWDWTLTPVSDEGRELLVLTISDAAHRLRSEERACAEEARVLSLLASMPAMLYRAGAGWSAEALIGAEALTGRSALEINRLPQGWLSLVHPEDRERVASEGQRLPQAGSPTVQHYRILTRRGEPREVEDHKRVVPAPAGGATSIEGMVIDVSARWQERRALEVSEERYRKVMETCLDGFLVADSEGRLLDANQAYCTQSGYSREELLRLRIGDLDAQESAEETRAHIRAVKKLGGARFESVHRRRDGGCWPVEISTTWTADLGGRFFVFVRDIQHLQLLRIGTEARLRMGEIGPGAEREELLQAAAGIARRATGSECALLRLIDSPQTLPLEMACGGGGLLGAELPRLFQLCLQKAQPTYFAGRAEALPPALLVPLVLDGRVAAVLCVGGRRRPYDRTDATLLGELLQVTRELLDRHEVQSRLQHSEENLRRAQEIAHVGSWHLNLADAQLEWSEETYRIFGLPQGERIVAGELLARVHPDDRARVAAARAAALRGEPYDIEHRILTADSPETPVKWVNERVQIVHDEGGKPCAAIGTVHDISASKAAEENIARLEQIDALTGLPNRRSFVQSLERAVARADRLGQRLSLLIADLDLFKNINDGFGHAVGDRLLEAVALRLRELAGPQACLARLGGDEFALLIENSGAGMEDAARAETLIAELTRPFVLDDVGEVCVSASVGISSCPQDGTEAHALLRNADAALYLAKAQGRGLARCYEVSLTRSARQRVTLESRLRRAIEEERMVLHYQPLVRAADGAVIGVEALVRWHDETQGLVPPMAFIPLAEESGLIAPLGEWVLNAACAQMQRWRGAGGGLQSIAVNLSARQFVLQDVVAMVGAALQRSGLPAEALELEITESVLLEHGEAAIDTLERLRALGVRLSIDDFGTGYSSLSYLKRLPIDKLKIDRSFVSSLPDDGGGTEIVTAVIAMARALHLAVLAEGVETLAQRDFLTQLGCDYFQGYLFSRPRPASDFAGSGP